MSQGRKIWANQGAKSLHGNKIPLG